MRALVTCGAILCVLTAGFAALLIVPARAAAGVEVQQSSAWTESYAEKRVVAKARLACKTVHAVTVKDKTCDLATQLRRTQELQQRKAACNLDPRCLIGLANSFGTDPAANIRHIRYGYALETATCTGTGNPDAQGYRFSRFRCKVDLADENIWARLAITVTGRTSFRWLVID